MAKEALGIPTTALRDSGFIPEALPNGYNYARIESFGQLYRLLHLVKHEGNYRERSGENGAEKDPSFQQAIFYGVVVRSDDKFLLYQRNTSSEQYNEARLSGKVSIGIGGHMEPTDLSFADSFYRELEEETEIIVEGSPVNLRGLQGNLDVHLMKKFVQIKPVGIVKDERDEVGKVHIGVVCRIAPADNVEVKVKAGNDQENVSSEYVSLEEYRARMQAGQLTPESWTSIVIDEELSSVT